MANDPLTQQVRRLGLLGAPVMAPPVGWRPPMPPPPDVLAADARRAEAARRLAGGASGGSGAGGIGGGIGEGVGGLPPTQQQQRPWPAAALAAAAGSNASVDAMFTCPISLEIMVDPVIAADGHCYERACIEQALVRSRNSPMTGAPLASTELIPNHTLRSAILEHRARAAAI